MIPLLLSILLFFGPESNCVQIAHDRSEAGPPSCIYTAEVRGAQSDYLNHRQSTLTVQNGVVLDNGVPADLGRVDTILEVKQLVLVSETNNYGIGLAATDDGDLITIIRHQSPTPDDKVLRQRLDEAMAQKADLRDRLHTIRVKTITNLADTSTLIDRTSTNLQQIQAINLASNAAIAAVRSAVASSLKSQADTARDLRDTQRELKDAQQELQALRQVISRLLKDPAP